MEHRHLLPNEIDLLVDGSVNAANAPLRAHLVECDDCRKRFDELRTVSDAVEGVPHFVPKLRFADSVMAGVQVSEPWHRTVAQSATHLRDEMIHVLVAFEPAQRFDAHATVFAHAAQVIAKQIDDHDIFRAILGAFE